MSIFFRGQTQSVGRLDPLKHHPSILPSLPFYLVVNPRILSEYFKKFLKKQKVEELSSPCSILKVAVYPRLPPSTAAPWCPPTPPPNRATSGSGDTAAEMTSEDKFRAPPPPRDGWISLTVGIACIWRYFLRCYSEPLCVLS